MKSVVIMIIAAVITVSALEFKQGVVLPPVDGSVWNGSAWVVK